jgi:hypothetical protein
MHLQYPGGSDVGSEVNSDVTNSEESVWLVMSGGGREEGWEEWM